MAAFVMSPINPLATTPMNPALNPPSSVPLANAQLVQNLAQNIAQNLQSLAQQSLQNHHEPEEQVASENMVQLSSAEERERKIFMSDVNKFMAEIGKPLSKIPIMGYKELDLYQLFKEVVGHGGFIEVVKNVGTWSKIWKRLGNFDPSITDSSFRLKKNYERYLLEYEYKCYPDHKVQAQELEKQLQQRKANQTVPTVDGTRPDIAPDTTAKKPSSPVGGLKINNPRKKVSRRKNSPFKDIAREANGDVKMPLLLGDLTVHSIGTVTARPPYCTEKHIYPIGFCSSRIFSSMITAGDRTKYTCTIKDDGSRPQFVVTAEDDEKNPITSHSPSGCWRTILKRVAARNTNDKTHFSVSGSMRFGLEHSVVSSLLRDLLMEQGTIEKDTSYLMELSNSPTHSKRQYSSGSSSSSDNSSDEELSIKRSKRSQFLEESKDLFTSREDMDDLESAVATLQALKNSM
eukprot:TRINITY_DN10863_c0_g1_i1.p1 TRINITY_DN10863_c0_g1~~TRINITY_DN10863_c0_g1_i1.p1  ORF type:complete len:460 (+),score=67.22 TRINITY_DN10863_c0_g1_i1:235-1614(+)